MNDNEKILYYQCIQIISISLWFCSVNVVSLSVSHSCIMYFNVTTTFLRLERLNIGTLIGKAKVLGTLMEISGAMILTFYKSTEIHIWSTHVNVMHHLQPHGVPTSPIWGCVLALGCCVSYSMWLIIQVTFTHYKL